MKKIITIITILIFILPNIYCQSPNELLLKAMDQKDPKQMVDIIELKGADVDLQDKNGYTTLMYCVEADRWMFATLLIELFDADRSIKNNKGEDVYELARNKKSDNSLFCLDSTELCMIRLSCTTCVADALKLDNQGESEFALDKSEACLDLCEEGYGKESIEYLLNLEVLMRCYASMSRSGEFLKYVIPVEDYVLENYENGDEVFYLMLSSLAMAYGNAKNTDKAFAYNMIVLKEYKKKKDTDPSFYLRSLMDMGMLFMELGLDKEALTIVDEAVEFAEESFSKTSKSYGIVLMIKGLYHIEVEEWDKALEAYKASNIAFKQEMKDVIAKTSYAANMALIGMCYKEKGDFKKAIDSYEEAIIIFEDSHLKEQLAMIRLSLLQLYYDTGEFDKIGGILLSNFKLFNHRLLENISCLDEHLALDYIKKIELNQDMALYSLVRLDLNDKEKQELINEFYKSYLTTKSLGQFGVSETRLMVLTNGDKEMEDKYQRYLLLKQNLLSVIHMPEKNRKELAGAILKTETEANMLEQELSKISYYMEKQLRDRKAEVSFVELKSALQPNEIAIDFIYHTYLEKKDEANKNIHGRFYSVVITHPNFDEPIFITLENSKKINEILEYKIGADEGMSYVENTQETGKLLYEYLFEPLEPYLKNIDHIHVSLSGRLYEVALHTLPLTSEKLLADKYSIHYHGTLRDLIVKERSNKQNKKPQSIAIMGNPDFDINMNKVVAGTTRSGFGPLPETKKEVVSIERISKNIGLETKAFTEEMASELAFTSLSGNKAPDIMHLATHGYFFPYEEVSIDQQIKETTGDKIKAAWHPLFRSGIILSGGNATWKSKEIISFDNDGILTSYEISNLNLINTDLVVLSACNTGLGTVNGTEGVYGLQRAFKIAGVENMIVSLWEVDDEATRLLMEKFYGHYLSGTVIYESLKKAQDEMRKNPKYAKPIFWAGFILVE